MGSEKVSEAPGGPFTGWPWGTSRGPPQPPGPEQETHKNLYAGQSPCKWPSCDRRLEVVALAAQNFHVKGRLSFAEPQLYLRIIFDFVLFPLPPGGPGEGPDCHFPEEIYDC